MRQGQRRCLVGGDASARATEQPAGLGGPLYRWEYGLRWLPVVRCWVRPLVLLLSVAARPSAEPLARTEPLPSRTGPESARVQPAPGEQKIVRALRVYAPPSCVDPEGIAATIGDWLGRDTLPTTWAVVIRVHGDHAEFSIFEVGRLVALRRFESLRGGCRDAETVLGASLGLALESLLARRAETKPIEFTPVPEAPKSPPPTPPPSAPAMRAEVAFSVGTLLHPAWGLGVFGSVPESKLTFTRFGAFALRATGVPVELGETKEARIESQLVALRVGQCLNDDGERLVLSGCFDALGGPIGAVGRGDMQPLDGTLPWFALGVGIDLRLMLWGPLALTASASANANLVRPTFRVIDDNGAEVEVRQTSELGLTSFAGVAWVYR